MSQSSDEVGNEGGRGCGKHQGKGNRKRRFTTESDSKNEADNESGGENESNEEKVSAGSQKYKKQIKAPRVNTHFIPAQQILIKVMLGATLSFPPTERHGGEGGTWSSCSTVTPLCPCYPRNTIQQEAHPHWT